ARQAAAGVLGMFTPPGASAPAAGPALWASAEIEVDGRDLSGVTLTLQPAISISGRIVVAAVGKPAPTDLSNSTVMARPPVTRASPAQALQIVQSISTAKSNADGAFTLTGLTPGKYLLGETLMMGGAAENAFASAFNWSVKSTVIDGVDVTDQVFELK